MFFVNRLMVLVIILAGLLLTACGGGGGAAPNRSTSVTPESKLDTVVVAPAPDTERRVTGTIGTLGGSVETVGADGTSYELFIPPGALPGDTEISITPTAVSGLQDVADATHYAVEFEPSGLTFATTATLTVRPPASVTVTVTRDDFAFSWEDGIIGIGIGSIHIASDGSFRIDVVHFSGMGTLKAREEEYKNILERTLASMTEIKATATLASQVLGLPATEDAVVNEVMRIYNAEVLPMINEAGAGVVQAQTAFKRLIEFDSLFQLLPIDHLAVKNVPSALTLADVLATAKADFLDKTGALLMTYVPGAAQANCSAQVIDLADWFVAPNIISRARNFYSSEPLPNEFCAQAVAETLVFPSTLKMSQRYVDVPLRGAIVAPVQTPGGTADGGRVIFPQPTVFDLAVDGATFRGSEAALITGDTGVLNLQLDRGEDETSRKPRVSMIGNARVAGFMVEVERLVSTAEFIPISESAVANTDLYRVNAVFTGPIDASGGSGSTTLNIIVERLDGTGAYVPEPGFELSLSTSCGSVATQGTTDAAGLLSIPVTADSSCPSVTVQIAARENPLGADVTIGSATTSVIGAADWVGTIRVQETYRSNSERVSSAPEINSHSKESDVASSDVDVTLNVEANVAAGEMRITDYSGGGATRGEHTVFVEWSEYNVCHWTREYKDLSLGSFDTVTGADNAIPFSLSGRGYYSVNITSVRMTGPLVRTFTDDYTPSDEECLPQRSDSARSEHLIGAYYIFFDRISGQLINGLMQGTSTKTDNTNVDTVTATLTTTVTWDIRPR